VKFKEVASSRFVASRGHWQRAAFRPLAAACGMRSRLRPSAEELQGCVDFAIGVLAVIEAGRRRPLRAGSASPAAIERIRYRHHDPTEFSLP
jgi:hypothetical protein